MKFISNAGSDRVLDLIRPEELGAGHAEVYVPARGLRLCR